MKLDGTIIKYGDNIDTDVVIPARYLNTAEAGELAKHCMEDLDPTFASRVQPGDLLVCGKNFGCGSSREHAPLAIKASGIACVIAEDFARIFYRNAINIGLPILECPDAVAESEPGDLFSVDLDTGVVCNTSQNRTYHVPPFPAFIQKIIHAGGLMNAAANGELEESP